MKVFRTLRGFIEGDEPDDEIYYAYSASLRIFGDDLDLTEITSRLELEPTECYRKGDRRKKGSVPRRQDTWNYTSPVADEEPLEMHIHTLWNAIHEHKDYLLNLKNVATVDVFLGYRSNCDMAGIEVPHECLEMFIELEIPFGISTIIT